MLKFFLTIFVFIVQHYSSMYFIKLTLNKSRFKNSVLEQQLPGKHVICHKEYVWQIRMGNTIFIQNRRGKEIYYADEKFRQELSLSQITQTSMYNCNQQLPVKIYHATRNFTLQYAFYFYFIHQGIQTGLPQLQTYCPLHSQMKLILN